MNRHTAIITGATRGFGRAMALAFARAGHRVLGIYANDGQAAAQLEKDLAGSDSLVLRHDVSIIDDGFWSRAEIQDAQSLVLIHNACAPFTPMPFHLLRWADFETSLNVGLKGSWSSARAVVRPMLRAGQGTIVNVLTAAVSGLPAKGFAAYATAKHAVRGLTLALAAEYSGKGIRTFSVSPGFMATELTAGWDARLVEAIRSHGPVSDPTIAAERVRELVESPTVPGNGEDYPV